MVATLGVLAGPGLAHASAPELFGMGARSGALAGTGAADAEGYEASYLNPAGLGARRRLTVGVLLGRYHLQLDRSARHVDETNAFLIGGDIPLPLGGPLQDRLALGFALYFPYALINRVRESFPSEPRLVVLDNRTQVVTVAVAAAARLSSHWTLGAGVLVLADHVGEIRLVNDAAGRIVAVTEQQLVADYAPVAGLRWRPSRWLALGAAVRGESKSTYRVVVTNRLALPIQLPILNLGGVSQYDPLQAALEAALSLRGVRVELGVTWKHFSAMAYPTEKTTSGAPPLPPVDFHDTAVPRLAVELAPLFRNLELKLRAGYFFEWSPAPSGPERPLVDADRHVFTAGSGLHFHSAVASFAADLFAQWHHLGGGGRAQGDFAVFGLTFGLDL